MHIIKTRSNDFLMSSRKPEKNTGIAREIKNKTINPHLIFAIV